MQFDRDVGQTQKTMYYGVVAFALSSKIILVYFWGERFVSIGGYFELFFKL
jgi:hypothetical protein